MAGKKHGDVGMTLGAGPKPAPNPNPANLTTDYERTTDHFGINSALKTEDSIL